MRIFRHSSTLSVEAMNRISGVIDHLELPSFVIKAISAFDVALCGSFFITELPIEAERASR